MVQTIICMMAKVHVVSYGTLMMGIANLKQVFDKLKIGNGKLQAKDGKNPVEKNIFTFLIT